MNKREFGRDLENVSDEVLGGLEPEERVKLIVESNAQGNDQWIDRLVKTAPAQQYRGPDPEFRDRMWSLMFLAWEAKFALFSNALMVHWHSSSQEVQQRRLEDLGIADDLPDEVLQMRKALYSGMNRDLINLYVKYHAYERFATEELDTELKSFLRLVGDNRDVVEFAEMTMSYFDPQLEKIKQAYSGDLDANSEDDVLEASEAEADLDSLVDDFYDDIRDEWIGPWGKHLFK